ncbi:hypothetical protein [Shewanella sp. M-Br]|uniref:hypothetical protein n=1 Tax=Shewanella sp. M-Br TaxID=2495595 RepID=UPI0030C70777
MEVSKKLTIPEIIGLFCGLCSVILFCGNMSLATTANTTAISENKTSIIELTNRYNSTEQFKSRQENINMNQDKLNSRLESVLYDVSKSNAELAQAVVKLEAFLSAKR